MKTLIVLTTVLASSLVGVAQAATRADEIRQRVVTFADLDLQQDAGAEKLYWRIRTAAREVCATPGVLGLFMAAERRQCAEQAAARAIADVNAPSLTRYHVGRNDAGAHQTALVQRNGEGRGE
ncbi:MAG: UrcA family protein [Steroidobacter sp.]